MTNYIKKSYGYVTRLKGGITQVLVFQHPVASAGIQIPKGTVEKFESPYNAVIREIKEETGLEEFHVKGLIAKDLWEYEDGVIHERYFFEIQVDCNDDYWTHNPSGGGEEDNLVFSFFWISSINEVDLVRGHGDYLPLIFGESPELS